MTLRALEAAGRLALSGVTEATGAERTAIAFAFDRGYLHPFKVLLFTLARVGGLSERPLYVYTDDPAVLDDPVVAVAADRKILIEPTLLRKLRKLAATQVGRPERAEWNRGTFLKWTVFEPGGAEQVLFLDVDLLVLKPIEALLSQTPRADMVGCPQFQRRMMADGDGPLSADAAARTLEAFCDERLPQWGQRLNSGVMVIRPRLLSEFARRRMIRSARERVLTNEQSHLTEFFRSKPYRLAFGSPLFNFQESYLALLAPTAAAALLSRIHVLHYAGDGKPWKADRADNPRPSQQLWWDIHDAALDESGLLAS